MQVTVTDGNVYETRHHFIQLSYLNERSTRKYYLSNYYAKLTVMNTVVHATSVEVFVAHAHWGISLQNNNVQVLSMMKVAAATPPIDGTQQAEIRKYSNQCYGRYTEPKLAFFCLVRRFL
jgi:hypothetical protein